MADPKWPESVSDLLTPDELVQMSGLEFLSKICTGELPAPPIARSLHYRMDSVEEGRVIFRGTPHLDAMNPIGTIHGGWFGTLLDSCMACAIQTLLPAGRLYTTLEYKINILRPLLADGPDVLAIGEAVHVGRRTATGEGRIIGAEDGKLYATGTTTCMVFEQR